MSLLKRRKYTSLKEKSKYFENELKIVNEI